MDSNASRIQNTDSNWEEFRFRDRPRQGALGRRLRPAETKPRQPDRTDRHPSRYKLGRLRATSDHISTLGQGLFRILVTDAYSRRCAVTGERTLPALEATHIKPYSLAKRHEVSNGLLLRSDLHRLFDEGDLTVDPKDRRIIVSKRIKEEFENGKDYYALESRVLREPVEPWARPSAENLEYHAYSIFR